jgi:arylsulfatase
MKLVRIGREGPWELYDLAKDRTEINNLAAENPSLAKELEGKWEAWALRAHVKPYPGNGNKQKTNNKKQAVSNNAGNSEE